MNRKGLTLTEVMITVSIIGVMAGIVMPVVGNFRLDAEETICKHNLKAIDRAKMQWALTEERANDEEPTEEDLGDFLAGEFPNPVVAGALYDISNVANPALCSFHGNGIISQEVLGQMPFAFATLINEGKVTAPEIIEGSWYWQDFGPVDHTGTHQSYIEVQELRDTPYTNSDWFTGQEWDYYDVNCTSSHTFEGPLPKFTLPNGRIIEAHRIHHLSAEYIEHNSRDLSTWSRDPWNYSSSLPPYPYYIDKMSGGGYVVHADSSLAGITGFWGTGYYDNSGELLGYSDGSQCYDSYGYSISSDWENH